MLTNNQLANLIIVSLTSPLLLLSQSPSEPFESRPFDQVDQKTDSDQEWLRRYKTQLGTTAALLLHEITQPKNSPFSNKLEIRDAHELRPVPEYLRPVLNSSKHKSPTLYSAELNDYACSTQEDIYIDSKVLQEKTFSEEAKKFIVSHEYAHITNNDIHKKALTNIGIILAAPVVLAAYDHYSGKLFDYVLNKLDNDSTQHTVIQNIKRINSIVASSPITQILLTLFLQSCYSCHIEKQADLTAAHNTSAQAGADFALTLKVLENREDAQMSPIDKLGKKLSKLLASHPSHAERFNYLVDLASKQSGSSKKKIIKHVTTQVTQH